MAFFASLQTLLRTRAKPVSTKVSRICAVDAAYRGNYVIAVASVLEEGRLVEKSVYRGHCTFPYVSGLFYLREGPFAVETVRRLEVRPHLVCFDAHGAAHPRHAGLATVCGMVLGIPSIGIAKSLLMGRVVSGAHGLDRMLHEGKTVGLVTTVGGVTTYWSAGYSVNLRSLGSLVHRYGQICLQAVAESHRTAKEEIQARSKSLS